VVIRVLALSTLNETCVGCMVGKQSREKFPPIAFHEVEVMLELIHMNICGPLSIPSMSKSRYFITFTNDYNRHTWIYFMKTKFEAFNIFNRFKQKTKVEFGKQVKMFCFNGRKEYNSKEFEELLL
jgi:hypothetical protein